MKYQMEDLSEWQRVDGVNHPHHHAPLNQSQVRAYAVVRGTANSDLGPLYTQAASSEYDVGDAQCVSGHVDIRRDAKQSIDDRLYGKTCLDTATTTATIPQTFSEDESQTPRRLGKDPATPFNSPSATREGDSKVDSNTTACSNIADRVTPVVMDIKPLKFETPVLHRRVVQVAPPTPYSLEYHDILRMEYVNRQLPLQSPTPRQKPSSVTEAIHAQYAADLESYELSPFPDSRQATSVTEKSQVFTLSDYEEESSQSIAGNTTEYSKTMQDSWSIPPTPCQDPERVVAMYAGLTSEVDGDSLQPGVRDYQGHFQSAGAGPDDLLRWSEGALKGTEKIHLGIVYADQTGPLFTATPGRDKTAELPKQVTYIGQLDEQDNRPMTPFVPDPDDHPIPLRSPIGVDMDYMPKTFARMNPKLYAQHERNRRIEESGQDVRYVKIIHQAESDTGKEAEVEVFTSDDVFDAFENPGVGKYTIVDQAWNDVTAALQKNADLLDAATTAEARGVERCNDLLTDITNLREYLNARAMADANAQHNRMLCRYAKIRQTFLQAYHARLDVLARSATTASDMQAAAADMEKHLAYLGGVFENLMAEFDLQRETLAQAAACRYMFGEENTACSGGVTYARRLIQPAVYSMEEWVVTSCQDGATDIIGRPIVDGQVLPNSLVPNGHAFMGIDFGQFSAPMIPREKPLTVPVSINSAMPSKPVPSTRPNAFADSAPAATSNPVDPSASITTGLADLVTGPRVGAYDRSLVWNCRACGDANYGLGLMCDYCGIDRENHTSNMVHGSSEYRTTADLKRLAQVSIAPLRICKMKVKNQTPISPSLDIATNVKLDQNGLGAPTFSGPSKEARYPDVVDGIRSSEDTSRQSSDVSVMGNKSLSCIQQPSARREVNSKVFLYNGPETDTAQDLASTSMRCRSNSIIPFDPRGRPMPVTPAKVQRVVDSENHVESSDIDRETYVRVVSTFL